MANVYVSKSSYDDYDKLKDTVFALLDSVDEGSIGSGTKVLIKPNLLSPVKPEFGITTHPLIIRATAEYALGKGATVRVSDSNAMGSFKKIIEVCGLRDALGDLPVEISPLEHSIKVDTDEKFSTLELSSEVLDTDVIINLPKLKTHTQMGLTLAVKNLFGCVVGARKPVWHYRVGEDKELFAELMVTIFKMIRPSINLLDGILALEGQGPGTGGTPRHLGMLMASSDAVSIDIAVCKMLGIDDSSLMTNKAAEKLGLYPKDVQIMGELPLINDFNIPATTDLLFGPKPARGFIRRHIASRPKNELDVCKYCDECVKICPASAITNTGKNLVFDYDKCIRCYCCVEVCPHSAMFKHSTLVKKFFDFIVRVMTGAKGT